MLKKIPIIRSCASCADILRAVGCMNDEPAANSFGSAVASYAGAKHFFLTNSGISSFYIILKALERLSGKKEVVLPAYTAGSLVVAVRKAGLKPVLCDISLEDLNLDEGFLTGAISADTLAVVGVHMFGINMKGIAGLRAKIPHGVFLIEDCAQSMGSRTLDRMSGSFGDVGFFSFNRGKNLPLYGGGCIVTSDGNTAEAVGCEISALKSEGALSGIFSLLKIIAFHAAGNPLIYGLGFPLISHFKETAPPEDFKVRKIGGFQAGLGCGVIQRMEDLFSARYHNGMSLISALNAPTGVILPRIPDKTRYVFNRLPIVFEDIGARAMASKRLWANGIETSRMYHRPLHYMFDMGYRATDFPNAVYLAERLLALPVHPYVTAGDIKNIADTINEVLR